MTAKIDGKNLVITVPIMDPAPLSGSGKSFLVASASEKVDVQVKGKQLKISLNAFISAK